MKSKSVNPNLNLFPVAAGVWGMKEVFVNVYMILNPEDNSWVLVDAGLKRSATRIRRMAQLVFGENAKPSAILLTHGHFDHVGSLTALAELWDVPVYAHHLELPYLTGLSSYPPADTTVGGGLFADLSFLYSKKPINIEKRVLPLPSDGSVPGLPDWKYIHTPGHSPGHVSFFREKDRVLISGDAVVTTKAESFWFTALQLKKISGPPKYLTSDWLSSAASVEELAALEPNIIASGHGRPIRGAGMRKSLHNLADHFDRIAVPYHGRYIHQPALSDDTGVVHVPPKNSQDTSSPTLKFLGVTVAVLITVLVFSKNKKKKVEVVYEDDKQLAKKYRRQLKNDGEEAKKKALTVTEEIQQLKQSAIAKIRQSERSMQDRISDLEKGGKRKYQDAEKYAAEKYRKLEKSGRQHFDEAQEYASEKYRKLEKSGKKKFDEAQEYASDKFQKGGKIAKKNLKQAEKKGGNLIDGLQSLAGSSFNQIDETVATIKKDIQPAIVNFLEKIKFDVKKRV